MTYDKFLIGFNDNGSGLQTNLKPFLINDNAFEVLENAYIFRGRLRKRFGSEYMGTTQLSSRLRTLLVPVMGVYTVPGTIFAVGQMFSVPNTLTGNDTFTVYQPGTPAAMLASNPLTSGTFNTTTGVVTITGEVSTDVYYYPSLPVMGITLYYSTASGGSYSTVAFDTQFAYQFNEASQAFLQLSGGASTWTGSDSQFFWMTNYQGVTPDVSLLWVTNNNVPDGIRYFDSADWVKPVLNWSIGPNVGITNGSGTVTIDLTPYAPFFQGQVVTVGLTSFVFPALPPATVVTLDPQSNSPGGTTGTATFDTGTNSLVVTTAFPNTNVYFSAQDFIQTALIIVSFKNRLLFFNTTESVTNTDPSISTSSVNYQSRVRYSGIGSPLYASSWQQDFPGNGSAIDAPTTEAIVTAQFIKDRLIVYFDSSTYELAYTGNQVLPFVWQKINTELGATSTYSEVPFDKAVLGISNIGIHACNGSNVERIDSKIPQLAFNISALESGSARISGVRDYYTEMVYWTYSSSNRSDTFYFPDQVLVYNYVNDSWGINDDSFTTFGYYYTEIASPGDTWESTVIPWGENGALWNASASASANANFKTVVAGNQQGFITIIDTDIYENAAALSVNNFAVIAGDLTVSCVNHNLQLDDYILFNNMNGIVFTNSSGKVIPTAIGKVISDTVGSGTPNSFVVELIDVLFGQIFTTGSYIGGGTIARVSEINILTKQYNFYTDQDRNMYIPRVDFLVDKTDNGKILVDYYVSSADVSIVEDGIESGALLGNNVLETSPYPLSNLEKFQSRLWHPVYFSADGECIQLNLYLNPYQLVDYTLITDSMGNSTCNYVALQNFELNAMVFYATPTASRMQ